MRQSARANRLWDACVRGVLILGMIHASAFGVEFAGGTGEPNSPYRIATREQLLSIGGDALLLSKHFELIEDIDLDPNLPGGSVFAQAVIAPAGEDSTGAFFTGSFDGKGHAIKHLTIDGGTSPYIALSGRVGKAGNVHDLILEEVCISSSSSYVAGLVGYNRGGITDCRVTGRVSGGAGQSCTYVGLLAGQNCGRIRRCDVDGSIPNGTVQRAYLFGLLAGESWGAVSDCTAQGAIKGGSYVLEVGGLIGGNAGSIADCWSATAISLDTKSGGNGPVGGLVGSNSGPVCRSYATGRVTCDEYVSGVGGLAGTNNGTVAACYATGDCSGVFGNNYYGGLVGANYGYVVHSYAKGKVTADWGVGGLAGRNHRASLSQCYAVGKVAGGVAWNPVGGLVGLDDEDAVTCSFWDMEASGTDGSRGGTGLSTAEMKDTQTFLEAGWDFLSERNNGTADVWAMQEYPQLTIFGADYQRHKLQGAGTAANPYRIATIDDLGAISHYDTAACYRLTADIDMNGVTWTTPVVPSFEGRFDGGGFTISNLDLRGQGFLGLFGALWNEAVVENLTIENAHIVAGDSASDLGLLVVENWGRIANCHVTGSISAEGYEVKHGGMAATNYGTITDCGPVNYSGPYTVIVTNEEATAAFLKWRGIDEVWIPTVSDLEGLDEALRAYLDRDLFVGGSPELNREYVLANLRRYDRQYSGFVKDGAKYIMCQMVIMREPSGAPGIGTADRFSAPVGGDSGVVRVAFNAQTKAVVLIEGDGW